MALIKGSALTARFDYLRREHPRRWPELVTLLDSATQALARGPCLKGSWYPFSSFVELNVKADKLLGHGDLALARLLGKEAAKANLPTLYKLFYKVGSPEYIFARAASLWSVHHDTGRSEVVWDGRESAEWRTHDFAMPHAALCRSMEGYVTGSLEMMKMNDIHVEEIECVLKRAPYCSTRGTWHR